MPLFSSGKKKLEEQVDFKARLERKLCLAKEDPEPIFDLSYCNLKNIPSGTFITCRVLRKTSLLLQCNRLQNLHGGGSFADLSLLELLDISSNELKKLPDELWRLTNLKVLKASHNQLTVLPDALGRLLHLEELDVSDNLLKELPANLSQLPALRGIFVRGNPLKESCNASGLIGLIVTSKEPIFSSNKLHLAESLRMTELSTETTDKPDEIENNERLCRLLDERHQHQKELVSEVSRLAEEQENAVGRVLEQQRIHRKDIVAELGPDRRLESELLRHHGSADADTLRIHEQIADVQARLGWLSAQEIKKKELASRVLLNEFADERGRLSFALSELLQQQQKRRNELLDELSRQQDGIEAKLWSLQLDRLLHLVPESKTMQTDILTHQEQTPSAPPLPESPVKAQITAGPSAPPLEECVVCMDAQSAEVFLPCGHVCCCGTCARALNLCPLCRSAVQQHVSLFWAQKTI